MAPQSRECSTKLRGSSALATLTSKSRSELGLNKLTLANAGVLGSARDTGGSKDWYNICYDSNVGCILYCSAAGSPTEAVPGPDRAAVTLFPSVSPTDTARRLPSSRSRSRCVKMPQRFGKLVMSFFSFNNCIK